MKSVVITGVSGSGKSSLVPELQKIGYEAHDLEEVEGLFTMLDKITKQPVVNHNNEDIEKVKRMDWICDVERLQTLLANQKAEIAFYSGIPSNTDEILPLFDQKILLIANTKEIRHRLSNRTSNDFGRHPNIQEWILNGKEGFENFMREKGAIVVDANQDIASVAKEIVEKTSAN